MYLERLIKKKYLARRNVFFRKAVSTFTEIVGANNALVVGTSLLNTSLYFTKNLSKSCFVLTSLIKSCMSYSTTE